MSSLPRRRASVGVIGKAGSPTPPLPVNFGLVADALQVALSRCASLPEPPGHSADTAGLAGALQMLLMAVDRGRDGAPSTTGSHLAEFRRTAALRDAVVEVSAALSRTLMDRLEGARLSAARRLMAITQPDLLGVLGKRANENAHSDVLRWLLDPANAPTLAPHALAALFARIPAPPQDVGSSVASAAAPWPLLLANALECGSVSVKREHVLGDAQLDRIDLLLSGPGFLVAVENKVRSGEHDDQTITYASWLQANAKYFAGFFLTPAGGWATSRHFAPLSYLELVEILLAPYESDVKVTANEEMVLGGYLRSLSIALLRTELQALEGEGRHGAQ